jgi:hypothetical protein
MRLPVISKPASRNGFSPAHQAAGASPSSSSDSLCDVACGILPSPIKQICMAACPIVGGLISSL